VLPPKRIRHMLMCDDCRNDSRRLVLGRITSSAKGQTVLYVRSGTGSMVTDAATANEWIIVCAHGHQTVFHGHTVVWKQAWEDAA
jgi:hypothetical protein